MKLSYFKVVFLSGILLFAKGLVFGASNFCVTPYLQRPATDAMTIIFFTDSACTATVTCGGQTTNTVGVWAQALTNNVFHLNKNDKEEKNKWNNSLYKHRVRFEGLKPNSSYDYTVTLDGGATYSNKFRTAPDRNTPIRFVSYADCETRQANHRDEYTQNLKKMKSRDPDLITTAGDLTARGGIQSHWDEFWMQNAGGNNIGYTDILGSIPMITPIGNHDLFDNAEHNIDGFTGGGWFHDRQGEVATEKFLTYFEHNTNGVPYDVRDGTDISETRDMSQLFHREDYGPVTLIFLDTNNGTDYDPNERHTDAEYDEDTNYENGVNDTQHLKGGMNRFLGGRHPDFHPGTPQYNWLTNQLADAQKKSRFTFVFNHHCPYSVGSHNKKSSTGEDSSAWAVRVLTETMVRYGVDGWYCGHDELLEHSITNGYEKLPNGQLRKHTLSIYDLGCSGDSPRSSSGGDNPLAYWKGSSNYGGSGSYGFLETDVTTNKNGKWTCTITPIQGSTGNAVSNNNVGAQIIYVENPERNEDENDLVYVQASNNTGSRNRIDGASQTKPADWLPFTRSSSAGEDNPPDNPEDPSASGVMTNLYRGCAVTSMGAERVPLAGGDDLILRFSESGTLVVTNGFTADILVVGGGGSGGSGGGSSGFQQQGFGGKGGGVNYLEGQLLGTGIYTCTVGAGGGSIAARTTGNRVGGNPGEKSSLSGGTLSKPIEGAAGGAGPTSNSAVIGAGTDCSITGDKLTYGKDGASSNTGSTKTPGTDGDPNTGNGGSGGQYRAKSGAGGSGVIIVRIKAVAVPPEPTPFELMCAAAETGGTYGLEENMEFPEAGILTVPAGVAFVLDLKGHAITCHADGAIVNHGTLTIINSTKAGALTTHLSYSAAEIGSMRTLIKSDGELIIDGVFVDAGVVDGAQSEFGGGNTAITATAGTVMVKNGAHIGGKTAIDATGAVSVEIVDSHVAGRRSAAVALTGATLVISNSTLEAEGQIVRATASAVTIVDSTLATSYTTAPFNLGSGAVATVEKSIYVDRMASWFPVTTALANDGANLKIGAGCLLAVASESVIGFLDEGVTAGEVAPRVWRTKGKNDEPLPPLTDEEKSRIAEVLSSSPDALLKASVTEVKDYTVYRAWVDKGVAAGTIDSQAAAKGAEGSFFSFATDQKGLVDPATITSEKVKVKEMMVNEGAVRLTVGIEGLPVGENAQAEYLEKIFGVTGTSDLGESFTPEKVVYKKDMQNNGDGTVSYTAEPKVEAGEALPNAFFFKATIAK